MALIKQIQMRGVTASYFYLESLRFSKSAQEVSASFALCVDKAHRAKVKRGESEPLTSRVATVRIIGEEFDNYFTPAGTASRNIEAGVFRAIREGKATIKMDAGAGFLRDAVDDD